MLVAEWRPDDCWLTWMSRARIPKLSPTASSEDHARVAEREEEPRARADASLRRPACVWCCRWRRCGRVEGVSHAQRVGQHAGSQPEQLGLRDMEVVTHRRGQQHPADNVQEATTAAMPATRAHSGRFNPGRAVERSSAPLPSARTSELVASGRTLRLLRSFAIDWSTRARATRSLPGTIAM